MGNHVLSRQPKIQVCDPPPDHPARMNSSQAQHCCSLCRDSEGQARSTHLSNSNTKPGTPAALMVLCSQGKFYLSLSLDELSNQELPSLPCPSKFHMTEAGCLPEQLKPRHTFSPCLREAFPHILTCLEIFTHFPISSCNLSPLRS